VAWSRDGESVFAAGHYTATVRNPRQTIARWDQGGRGKLHNFAVSEGSLLPIHDLLALPNGVAYSTINGEIGIMNNEGMQTVIGKQSKLPPPIPSLRISANATVVELQPEVLFDIERRAFVTDAVVRPPMTESREASVSNWKNARGTRLNGNQLPLEFIDTSRSLAISPHKDRILLGTLRRVYCFDLSARPCWGHSVVGPAFVNISDDGRIGVAALNDGSIRWYRMSDGNELLALFPHADKHRWVMWTPKGYFDAPEGSEDLVGWHVNQGKDREALFYPASRFFEQYYRPDIVAEVVRSVETDAQVLARLNEKERVNVSAGFKKPPTIRILSLPEGAQIDREELEIQVQAFDHGGGIDEIRLYQNGKVLGNERRGIAVVSSPTADSKRETFHVVLVDGLNTFKAVALSTERVEGEPAETSVYRRGSTQQTTLHLLVVGINEYKNRALNLNYAIPDAKGLADFFAGVRGDLFKDIKRYEFYDHEATKEKLLAKLKDLRNTAPQDVVMIYLAGHGEVIGQTW
jgi:hypothetical protein